MLDYATNVANRYYPQMPTTTPTPSTDRQREVVSPRDPRLAGWRSFLTAYSVITRQLDEELRELDGPIARVDISQVSEIDTVGAWIACNIASEYEAEITGASDRAKRLLGALADAVQAPLEGFLGLLGPLLAGQAVVQPADGGRETDDAEPHGQENFPEQGMHCAARGAVAFRPRGTGSRFRGSFRCGCRRADRGPACAAGC